jgi:soluble lytic murein transglycosylase-like protein
MTGRRSAHRALASILVAAAALAGFEARAQTQLTPELADQAAAPFAGAPLAAPTLVRPAARAQALSPWDAQLYAAAFDALRRGDFSGAEAKVALVTDKCLLGLIKFQELFRPKAATTTASYDDLNDWLSKYGDLPAAARVWEAAKKRKPAGAADPVTPAAVVGQHSWASLDAAAIQADLSTVDPTPLGPKAAREAFNAGDMDSALKIGDSNGDRFTAGLAAFRQGNWDEAFRRFQSQGLDVNEDMWGRSAGAWWAARAAIARGHPDQAPALLRVAAQFPNTFYGQIAERQLGLEPVVRRRAASLTPSAALSYVPGQPMLIKATTGLELDQPEMALFIRDDARAHRALALAELGQKADAGLELKAGLSGAADEPTRAKWTALAQAIGAMFAKAPEQQVVNEWDYPMPDLNPRGGYTVDKALLYALIRRESRFDARVISYAGAYGLMQVMPATASLVENDDRLRRYPDMLFDPSINLRVGQDYLAWLMNQGPIDGDLLKTVAAYNGGPGPIFSTVKQLPPDVDVVLLIESIPVPQSRDYVKQVMAAYWIYRRLMGQDSPSLDAVAAGAHTVNVAMDQPQVGYAVAAGGSNGGR